ncbi:hypothetical protein Misp06_04324 [Microbulbifer sp. NBRC 101763]|uniref:hypothetical protein n=1 Tax=Microbulbifer sp. NBRC 101763 TaxID=1113820 RepID=UPI0030ADB72C
MKIPLFIFVVLFSGFVVAEDKAQDDMSSVIDMMIVAKATGMCGVLSQLINFQQTTKMAGGDEFLVRFLNTEAARLGHTTESMVGQCPAVVEKYNSTMKLLGYE